MFKQKKLRTQTVNNANHVNVLENNKEFFVERSTHVECILRTCEDFIKKLKACLVIPQALSFSVNFSEDDILEIYLEKNHFRLKNTFHTNELLKLLDFIDEHLGDSSNFSSKYADFLSEKDKSLMNSFSLLYNIMAQRLPRSALSDLSKEKKLHKLNRSIGSFEKSIVKYSEKFRKQRIANLWNLAYKGGLIQKYEEDLAFQKWDNNLRIKQEIVRSSKNIRSLQELSFGILKELEVEATVKRTTYNELLRENLEFERESRMEKKKLLFQLQTCIRKYDQNIGEQIKENLHLQEVIDEKKKNFAEFLVEYNRQEQEYQMIVQQKEIEDQQIFEQKLMVFMMSRAARVIQIYWRRFRRDQKKKTKRGKGKGKRK